MCCCRADLAGRLRAAAVGGDYQQDLSDGDDDEEEEEDDAEISELEGDLEAHPLGVENGKHAPPEDQPQDEGDVRNSPEGHPWGAEVGTLRFRFVACLLQQHIKTCVDHYLFLAGRQLSGDTAGTKCMCSYICMLTFDPPAS